MLVLLALVAPALPCEPEPLDVRTVQPGEGQVDVPLDVRIAVSLIGWGTAEEAAVSLLRDGGEVAVERASWCYEHEGIAEVHCWWSLQPVEPLAPETAYQVRVDSTEAWQGEGSFRVDTRFTTGSALAEAPAGSPGLRVLEAWDEEAVDPCDYPLARRYRLEVAPAGGVPDPSALSLFHLDELDADGASLGVVHSVFVNNPGDPTGEPGEMKQYLDGAVARSDCFSLVQEGPGGARSAPVVACLEAGGDTGGGGADGGSDAPGDTGSADGGADGAADGGEGDGGGAGDGGAGGLDTGGGATAAGEGGVGRCGCDGSAAVLLLPAWAWRRRSGARRVPTSPAG